MGIFSKGFLAAGIVTLVMDGPASAKCGSVHECAQQAVEAALAARKAMLVAVPKGAVLGFNLEECPLGWQKFQPLAGRVVVGAGKGNLDQNKILLSAREFGQEGGEEAHQLSVDEMPTHHHSYDYTNHHNTPAHVDHSPNEFGFTGTPNNTSATGGDKPHNNMPPFYVLTYCERL